MSQRSLCTLGARWCEGRQVLPWAHCPGQGWAPGQAELASARPSPAHLGRHWGGEGWGALGAEPGRSGGGGGGGSSQKTLTPKTMSSPRLRQLIWSRPRFIKFS